ncbi:putative membrane protein YccC [Bradyrhizobium sp. USDA 10063]
MTVAIMAENLPTIGDAARPRLRSVITTIVLILISVMIVRDIFVRRWSSPSAPATDTTQHSR